MNKKAADVCEITSASISLTSSRHLHYERKSRYQIRFANRIYATEITYFIIATNVTLKRRSIRMTHIPASQHHIMFRLANIVHLLSYDGMNAGELQLLVVPLHISIYNVQSQLCCSP